MRILLVSANFRPSVGGIERFTEVLGAGLVENGHDVTVLCCARDGAAREEVTPEGLRIVRVPASNAPHAALKVPYPLPVPWTLRRTVRRLLREADLVHVQDAIYATSVVALRAARAMGVPSVLTQHVPFVPQANAALDALERVALATLGRSARLAGAVTTLNSAVAKWAEDMWGVRAEVLPIGVPRLTSSADRSEARAAFRLPDDRFLALFVGRDVPKKGLDRFLDAADDAYDLIAVTDRKPDTGDGVQLLPFMAHDRLQLLLRAVDAFVLPSVGEGLPIVLVEALYAGLPAVASTGQGYERYLGPDDVLLVEPNASAVRSALHRLVETPELRASLAERGRVAAEREFDVEGFVAAYATLYERVRGQAHGLPAVRSSGATDAPRGLESAGPEAT